MNSDQFKQRLQELESFYEVKLNELKSFYDDSLNEYKANSEIQIEMNEKQYQFFYSLVINLLQTPRDIIITPPNYPLKVFDHRQVIIVLKHFLKEYEKDKNVNTLAIGLNMLLGCLELENESFFQDIKSLFPDLPRQV